MGLTRGQHTHSSLHPPPALQVEFFSLGSPLELPIHHHRNTTSRSHAVSVAQGWIRRYGVIEPPLSASALLVWFLLNILLIARAPAHPLAEAFCHGRTSLVSRGGRSTLRRVRASIEQQQNSSQNLLAQPLPRWYFLDTASSSRIQFTAHCCALLLRALVSGRQDRRRYLFWPVS